MLRLAHSRFASAQTRNVNPRRRDIAAYTASVTTRRQLRRRFARRPRCVSRTIVGEHCYRAPLRPAFGAPTGDQGVESRGPGTPRSSGVRPGRPNTPASIRSRSEPEAAADYSRCSHRWAAAMRTPTAGSMASRPSSTGTPATWEYTTDTASPPPARDRGPLLGMGSLWAGTGAAWAWTASRGTPPTIRLAPRLPGGEPPSSDRRAQAMSNALSRRCGLQRSGM